MKTMISRRRLKGNIKDYVSRGRGESMKINCGEHVSGFVYFVTVEDENLLEDSKSNDQLEEDDESQERKEPAANADSDDIMVIKLFLQIKKVLLTN